MRPPSGLVSVVGGPKISRSESSPSSRSTAARTPGDLDPLAQEVGAKAFACDASKRADVDKLYADLDATWGAPDIVIYNASFRTRGPFLDLEAADVERALAVTAYGAFLVAQQAARRMLPKRHGAILFTGASASVKGYAQSAPFAMGKFALRGLAQSMARELAPKGIHVAHFVIDGGIGKDSENTKLDPDQIARNYLHVYRQHRSAWTWEIELRPWLEKF